MTAQVIERDKLGVLTKIGQGGQGVVYGAPNVKTKFAASMVYKEYKTQTLAEIDFTALAAMPALVEDSLSYAQAERLISMASWPCALVEDSGAPTGFVMPAIPEEFFIPLTTVKGVSSTTAEFQHLLNHSSVLAARGINIDDSQRYTLLREVASGLAFLHKHGVCVGDISPKNLLLSLAPHEAAYFIDCDAMRINGVSALPQVETPGWDTPAGEELATIYADTYKLGLLALRLLAGDQHTTNPHHLPSTTSALLRQIVTDTLTNAPTKRPLPEAWTYVLGQAIEDAQHQKKLRPAPVAPAPTALTPPPIPQVRSRPTGHSRPPVSPWAPPPAIVRSRPSVSPWARPQVGSAMIAPPGGPYGTNPYGRDPYWAGPPQGVPYPYPPGGPYANPQGGMGPYAAGAYPPQQFPQAGQQIPPGWPAGPYWPGAPPNGPRSKAPWLIIAGIALAGVIALVVILILSLGNGNESTNANPSGPSATTSAPTSQPNGSEQTATDRTRNVSGGAKPAGGAPISAGKLSFSTSAAPGWLPVTDEQSPLPIVGQHVWLRCTCARRAP